MNSRFTRLVIGTSRTVGSAKKFVRITSGFGGGGVPEVASQGMYMSKIEICFFSLEENPVFLFSATKKKKMKQKNSPQACN
jgi:hypothetical protein